VAAAGARSGMSAVAGNHAARWLRGLFATPVADFWHGYMGCLDRGLRGVVLVLAGLVAGWWVYVPLHELLHAAGCLASGGSVSRLEIDGLYGGGLLARILPFVTAGSDYAGRLSGFDTGGSDWVYLATDLAPFLLTVFPGVWALRRAGAAGAGARFGFSLPFALAPFLSLTGDAYEIGSILVTRLPPWAGSAVLRGDDAVLLAETLCQTAGAPWVGFALAVAVGTLWAFATYALGVAAAVAFSGSSRSDGRS
jgi:hypothetical protein